MPKPLLSSRHVSDAPNLVGRYLSDQKEEIRVLGMDSASNNTFVAYPPSKKAPLTVTVQHLEGQRYIVQAQPEGSVGVFLSVLEINLPNVTLYVFPNSGPEIIELAKRNQVTVNKDGLITEYKSAAGVVNLFMGLFGVEKRETVVFTKQAR
jgi:hypothetical protein